MTDTVQVSHKRTDRKTTTESQVNSLYESGLVGWVEPMLLRSGVLLVLMLCTLGSSKSKCGSETEETQCKVGVARGK